MEKSNKMMKTTCKKNTAGPSGFRSKGTQTGHKNGNKKFKKPSKGSTRFLSLSFRLLQLSATDFNISCDKYFNSPFILLGGNSEDRANAIKTLSRMHF